VLLDPKTDFDDPAYDQARFILWHKSGCLLQVKALNGLIREVTGIKPLSFWQPTEASNGNGNGSHGNGSNGRGKKGGIALKRPNKKKYRKGLPWQRYNGFGHKVRQFCVK